MQKHSQPGPGILAAIEILIGSAKCGDSDQPHRARQHLRIVKPNNSPVAVDDLIDEVAKIILLTRDTGNGVVVIEDLDVVAIRVADFRGL